MRVTRSPIGVVSDLVIDADVDFKGYKITNSGGLLLASAGYVRIEDSLADDLSWSGIVFEGTAGENLAQFETVYRKDDSKYWLAKADSADTIPVVAMAAAAITAAAKGLFIAYGWVRKDAVTVTVGGSLYQSAATGGLVTTTIPAASGNQIQKIGWAHLAHIMHFNPIYSVFEVA